jgi:hypothetical protein
MIHPNEDVLDLLNVANPLDKNQRCYPRSTHNAIEFYENVGDAFHSCLEDHSPFFFCA